MKRKRSWWMGCFMVLTFMLSMPVMAKEMTVLINGKQIALSTPPVFEQGSIWVPVKSVANALGYSVDYKTDYTGGRIKFYYTKGENLKFSNSQIMNVDAYRRNGSVYYPVRELGKMLMCESVTWDSNSQTLKIDRAPTFKVQMGALGKLLVTVNKAEDSYSDKVTSPHFMKENQKKIGIRKYGAFEKVEIKPGIIKPSSTDTIWYPHQAEAYIQPFASQTFATEAIIQILTAEDSGIQFKEEDIRRAIELAYSIKPMQSSKDTTTILLKPGEINSVCGEFSIAMRTQYFYYAALQIVHNNRMKE